MCLLSATFFTNAQNVAINNTGTAPNASAMPDITSNSKGLLIPRVALTAATDNTTITSPVTSLLIYNTATAGSGSTAVSPGFYFWNSSAWIRLITDGSLLSSGWMLGGNAGTNPAMHFIGTTDNNSLQFKVNNRKAGYIGVEATDGNVFLGYHSGNNNTGHSNVGIGVKTLFNNTGSSNQVANGDSALFTNTTGSYNNAVGSKSLFSNTTGYGNSSFGLKALYANTNGYGNTAIGWGTLFSNTTGNTNTAIGVLALYSNQTGSVNTALGPDALRLNSTGNFNISIGSSSLYQNTTGDGNTAYGQSALYSNKTGNNNTGIGFNTNVFTNDLSNATAIGANARVDCSNCLVLGSVNTVNGAVSSINVGIGMNNPSNRLHVFNGASGGSPFASFQTPLVVENNDHTYINLLSPEVKETGILFGKPGNAASGVIMYNTASTPNGFQFRNNGNLNRMVIDNTGNVGIGTIAPFAYGHGGNNRIMEINNQNTGNDIQSHLILSTNGTSGSTGGITWASQNVTGTEKRLGFIGDVYESSNAARMVFYTRNESGNLGERFTILGNGNIGIGSNNPGFLLEVNGSAGKVGGGSWSVTSDARMKDNVLPYTDGLSTLLSIKPVKFHYNQLSGYDTKPEYVGVLAQDIKSMAPYMVGSFQKKGETYYNVDNSAMTYMLIHAVKEQQQMINKQQQQIDELKMLLEKTLKK